MGHPYQILLLLATATASLTAIRITAAAIAVSQFPPPPPSTNFDYNSPLSTPSPSLQGRQKNIKNNMTALNPDIERPMILLFCISFLRIFLVKIYSVNDYDIIRPDPCLGPTITAHSHSFESDFKDDHLFYFQRPFN